MTPSARAVRRHRRTAAAALLGCLALAACSDGSGGPAPLSGQTGQNSQEGESDPTGEAGPGASQKPPASGTAVPLYFAGDGPGGKPRLFREFQRVQGDPLTEAARIIAGGGTPEDPDYRTLWPTVEISSVQPTDGVLLVEVPTDAFTSRPDGMTKREARLALQQLVYTLQGVQQERVPVVIDRPAGQRLFGLRTGRPIHLASAMRTLNLVNITAPAEGATITQDVLIVSGNANSFEGSGPCRLLQGGTEVALEGYQLAGWAEDRLFPFQVDFPLEGISGEVTVQCETDDPTGGTEGDGPAIDTRTIQVG